MSRKEQIILAAVFGLLLAAWLISATQLVPPIISAAFRGESQPVFNQVFRERKTYTLDEYLQRWNHVTAIVAVGIACAGLLLTAVRRGWLPPRDVRLATPLSLGSLRVLVCAILLANAVWEHLPSVAELPADFKTTMGVITLLEVSVPGFAELARNHTFLVTLQSVTISLLFLSMIGLRTRIVVPLAAVSCYLMGGILRSYSHGFHTCVVPMHLLLLLSFFPCGQGVSIDQLRTRRRGRDSFGGSREPAEIPQPRSGLADESNEPNAACGLGRYACWTLVAVVYFCAGFSKLYFGGFDWWQADNLRRFVYTDSLAPMQFDWGIGLLLTNAPDAFFAALGITTLVVELGYVLVLFSARARIVFPLLAAAMHLGIFAMQNILFFDLLLIQLVFLDVDKLWAAASSRWLRPPITAPSPLAVAGGTQHSRLARPSIAVTTVCLAFLGLIITAGLFKLRYYPFTGWEMYSDVSSEPVAEYCELVSISRDGVAARFDPDQQIPALQDTRYRDHFWRAFSPDHQAAFRDFLDTCAQQYNRTATGDQRIVRLELRRWRWNFGDHPHEPGAAELIEQFVHDLEVARTAQGGFHPTAKQTGN